MLCILITLSFFHSSASAKELFAIGAQQKSLGGGGVASPRDAFWVLINPASIVDLDKRADFGIETFYNHLEAEPKGFPFAANPFAGKLNDRNLLAFPSGGVVWPLKVGTIGIGGFGVMGNMSDYDRPRTTLALFKNADRRSRYQISKVPIAYAYQFDNGWAFGGAIVPTVTRFATDSITLKFRPAKGNNNWEYAMGIGFQLGLYKKWEKWSLGVNYNSRVWTDDFNLYEDDLAFWNVDLPQKLQVGLSWRPRNDLEFTVDYKWIDWSATKLFGNKNIDGGLGWQDQHIGMAGMEWKATDKWAFRFGTAISNQNIPDESVFINIITPGIATVHLATGATYKYNEHWEFHWAYTHTLDAQQTESGKGDVFSFLGKGSEIAYKERSFTAQVSYKF